MFNAGKDIETMKRLALCVLLHHFISSSLLLSIFYYQPSYYSRAAPTFCWMASENHKLASLYTNRFPKKQRKQLVWVELSRSFKNSTIIYTNFLCPMSYVIKMLYRLISFSGRFNLVRWSLQIKHKMQKMSDYSQLFYSQYSNLL